jgi:hypothetical protein
MTVRFAGRPVRSVAVSAMTLADELGPAGIDANVVRPGSLSPSDRLPWWLTGARRQGVTEATFARHSKPSEPQPREIFAVDLPAVTCWRGKVPVRAVGLTCV